MMRRQPFRHAFPKLKGKLQPGSQKTDALRMLVTEQSSLFGSMSFQTSSIASERTKNCGCVNNNLLLHFFQSCFRTWAPGSINHLHVFNGRMILVPPGWPL